MCIGTYGCTITVVHRTVTFSYLTTSQLGTCAALAPSAGAPPRAAIPLTFSTPRVCMVAHLSWRERPPAAGDHTSSFEAGAVGAPSTRFHAPSASCAQPSGGSFWLLIFALLNQYTLSSTSWCSVHVSLYPICK